MKIFSCEQLRNADSFTIKNLPIPSIELMENAARECVLKIYEILNGKDDKILIVCGPGNNGGDGLVIARLLNEANYKINVILIGENFSADNKINQERLVEEGLQLADVSEYKKLYGEADFIIDALLGSGITRAAEGSFKAHIDLMNQSKAKKISIDLPSGMSDIFPIDSASVVKADYTLTFHLPKFPFFMYDAGPFVGDVSVLNIGLLESAFDGEKPLGHLITKKMVEINFPKRNKFSHKGTYGHALIIAGSTGKMGAAYLSAAACLKTGSGLTSVAVPKSGIDILQTSLPEAMVKISEGTDFHSGKLVNEFNYSAIGVGPGIGTEPETADALKLLIQNTNVPLVLDADALNLISENKTWMAFLPEGSILTPHPKEFERLVGSWNNSMEMIQMQKDFSYVNNCFVVLKGTHTTITTPGGNLFINTTGNSGLAKGGNGDVLTGIITSLKAQGFSSLDAAICGVYLHGSAADLAVEKINEYGLIGRDVIECIPVAITEIQS